jgi:hypothetical protein
MGGSFSLGGSAESGYILPCGSVFDKVVVAQPLSLIRGPDALRLGEICALGSFHHCAQGQTPNVERPYRKMPSLTYADLF